MTSSRRWRNPLLVTLVSLALAAPLGGAAVDRWGARRVAGFAMFVGALACAMRAFAWNGAIAWWINMGVFVVYTTAFLTLLRRLIDLYHLPAKAPLPGH